MNGRILKIGAILFFTGIALVLFSVSVNPNFHDNQIASSANGTVEVNGLYAFNIPNNLTSTGPSIIVVSYNGTIQHFALVKTSSVSELNISNYASYNVSSAVVSQDQISYDKVPPGNYTFVSTQNITEIFLIEHFKGIELAGYTGTGGFYVGLTGFLTLIAGAVIKPKRKDFE